MVVFYLLLIMFLIELIFFFLNVIKFIKNKEKLLFVFEWIEMYVLYIYNYVVIMLVIIKLLIKVLINYRIGDFIYLCFLWWFNIKIKFIGVEINRNLYLF